MTDPKQAAELLEEAAGHHRAGRAAEARSIYQRMLAEQPWRLDLLELLAQLEYQTGDCVAAVALLRQAVSISPQSAHLFANLANVLAAQRQFDEAIELYRRALALTPDAPQILLNFAAALTNQGSLDESAETYRRVIAFFGDDTDVLFKLGAVLKKKGDLPAAIEAFGRALTLRPHFAKACEQQAFCLYRAGRTQEAVCAYRRLIELCPDSREAHTNLGVALYNVGEFEQAIDAHRQSIAVSSDYAEGHKNLGAVLMNRGRCQEAIQEFRRAVALHPDAAGCCSLGNALLDEGRLDEAAEAYQRALKVCPDSAEANNGLGLAFQIGGNLTKANTFYRAAWRQGVALSGQNLLVLIHLDPSSAPLSIYEEHAHWNQKHTAALAGEAGGYTNDRSMDRRLRVGLVSAYYDGHPVGRFLSPLLANHDSRQFEMICYSDVRQADAMTEALRGWADGWRGTLKLSDQQLARLIRADQIDILIDLGMHTRGNRMFTFARKPAPVQVTYLAYCSTTGLETIDYRVTDPYLDAPPGAPFTAEPFYSEQSVRLKSYWCYPPPSDTPTPNSLPAATNQFTTFGCLNDFSKISDLSVSMWSEILGALPDSHLVLHALEGSHRDRVTRAMTDAGVDPARVEFIVRLPMADYFQQYHRIDIALDPTPWPGGTTTCDALWMGVPVVSMIGKTAVSRGGLSILSHIGHPDLVARDQKKYVQTAISLARDRPRLAELRRTLRETMLRSPLMDAVGFARDFESCLRAMWHSYIRTS